MRRPVRGLLVPIVGLALPLLAGCNQGPAREAVAESEQAIEAARPQLREFAPEDLRALEGSLAEARRRLEEGRATESLALAQQLPGRVLGAVAKAEGRKHSLSSEWSVLAGRVPLVLDGAEAKARELAALRSLPRGMTPEALAAAQADLEAARRRWNGARTAFEAGQVREALEAARESQGSADSVAARLGLSPSQAMATAAAYAAQGSSPGPASPAPSLQGPRPAAPGMAPRAPSAATPPAATPRPTPRPATVPSPGAAPPSASAPPQP